jgi:hypothetical protein
MKGCFWYVLTDYGHKLIAKITGEGPATNRFVNLTRKVQDDRGINYIEIDAANNTYEEPITLQIAARNHQFTLWWVNFLGI